MEDTTGKYAPFGRKFIHYPQLLKGSLSLRGSGKKTTWRATPISHQLKCVVLDVIQDTFDPKKYDELVTADQEIFDRACRFAGVSDPVVIRTVRAFDRERDELLRRYEVLKGEILAGSDSLETLKKMRNLLLEMYGKGYIPVSQYNRLQGEILACL